MTDKKHETVFDTANLDDLVHGKIRLGIIASLNQVEKIPFSELRDQIGASDGNLSTHLKKLQVAGYIDIEKQIVDNRPLTEIALTPLGREAWHNWVEQILALMRQAV